MGARPPTGNPGSATAIKVRSIKNCELTLRDYLTLKGIDACVVTET